jgi:hypothetical protein
MFAPNDSAPSSRSVLMRFLVRSWEYRRPRLWVAVRVACGIFNVVLGVLLLAAVVAGGAAAGGGGADLLDRPPLADQCPELAWEHLPGAALISPRPAWGDASAFRLRFCCDPSR